MLKLQKFTGVNNVTSADELSYKDLVVARNVDLDGHGLPGRRAGYASASAERHANLYEGEGFTLATRGAGGDLVNVATSAMLCAGLSHTPRVWYWPLPDGRTLFSNGVVHGIVSAAGDTASSWGVPLPASAGAAVDVPGQLHPGKYQWSLTHVRLDDGVEGGTSDGGDYAEVVSGGIAFTGLPVLDGYRTNVYLTSHYGGVRYLAGSTTTSVFSFTGKNSDLVSACAVSFMRPAPTGILPAFWRGRALIAAGATLYASQPHSWELFDLARDYKMFSAPITLVQPTDGGVWVGTEEELTFLAGEKWDALVREVKLVGLVTLGSGVKVPGEHIRLDRGRASGDCMICIADGWLVAGTPDGNLINLTQDRYRTEAGEVAATFRLIADGGKLLPQYLATPL